MTFKEGLIRARSHIILIVALCAAFTTVVLLELWDIEESVRNSEEFKPNPNIPSAVFGPLSQEEVLWGRIAWQYFEKNYNPQTGLVNSVDNYSAASIWDLSSYLMALIAAYRLELIPEYTFDTRLSLALTSLARLPLFGNALPNKSYSINSLEMTDYNNKLSPEGIGWSAIDIARILVPLNIIAWNYPKHMHAVKKLLNRWDFDRLIKKGAMYGAYVNPQGATIYVQEGRLGYEQYAAKSLLLLGLDVGRAMNYRLNLKLMPLYDIAVPTDLRDPNQFKAQNYVVSEPYILDGLEFGWDIVSREFAYRVYRVQEERFNQEGILTAVSEDNIDRPPYFLYNTVFASGKFWNTINDKGVQFDDLKTLSVKTVFGWHALYNTEYTEKLMDRIKSLYDPDRGWYSGLYEKSQQPNKAITANTNAIILESLCYKQFGKLVNFRAE